MADVYQRMKQQDQKEAEEVWREYIERRRVLISTYGTENGRAMLRDLLDKTYFLATTINPKPDAMTYVREGQRNVGLEIIFHIPGVAAQVLREWLEEMELNILQRLEMEQSNG